MKLSDALQLVKEKYLEEQQQAREGKLGMRYADACSRFPVTMQTAHILWAHELSKGMP